MSKIAEWLQHARQRLLTHSPTPDADLEVLLTHVLKQSKAFLYSHSDALLTEKQIHQLEELLQKRIAGQPIAYLVGHREFWSLDLDVSEATLIPRPETEILIETCLKLGSDHPLRVVDLGTGSGAIALALATERPQWEIWGIDSSKAALAMAQQNAVKLGLSSITWKESRWFSALENELFDLIVSNPPYIAPDDPHLRMGDLRFEPQSALVATQAGYADLFTIIETSLAHLRPGGWLLLEHGYQQAPIVKQTLESRGYQEIQQIPDLLGHVRVSCAKIR